MGCGIGIVIIFGVDNSSSVHIDNKKKDISVLGKGPTQGLDDTAITAGAKYSINFSKSQIKFCFGNVSRDFTANKMKKTKTK